MKKIFSLITVFFLMLILTSCGPSYEMPNSTGNNLQAITPYGELDDQKGYINEFDLIYDVNTHIVYLRVSGDGTGVTPFISSEGNYVKYMDGKLIDLEGNEVILNTNIQPMEATSEQS